jgi:outer membrane protein assembly factor BamB
MGGIIMIKKAISFGIVGLFVLSGIVGLISFLPDEVEAPGPTYVSGLISTNATWTDADSPYIINGNTTLMPGRSLTIQDGTTVKFSNNTWLAIRGKLHVEGSSANRVVFTANDTLSNFTDERDYDKRYYYYGTGSNFQIFIDAENGGEVNISYAKFEFSSAENGALRLGSSTEPQIIAYTIFKNNKKGLWTGGYYSNINRCTFEDNYMGILNAKGKISNCTFRNNIVSVYSSSSLIVSYSSFSQNICGLDSGTATLEYCIISNNNFGIYELYDSTFTRNSIYNNKIGIIPMPDSFPITNNNIYDNTEYNIMLIGSPDLNVTNNWWGTTNTTIIDQYIYDIYDDISLGEAFYLPILTAPSPGAPTGSSGLQPGAPWPMFRGNVRHTGLSPYDTSGNTGELMWSFETGGDVVSSPSIDAEGTIYVGSQDGKLYAIYPNGTEKWNFAPYEQLQSSPAIGYDGTIYIGTMGDGFYAVNSNGTEKWHYLTGHWEKTSPVISSDGTIYLGSNGGNLYAINPNVTEKWIFYTNDGVLSSPAIGYDGTIFISTGHGINKLFAINPDGSEKWNISTNNALDSSPAIGLDGTIYIGCNDFNVYAIYPNGTVKWSFITGAEVKSSPAIGADGTIYVSSYDYKIYALNPNGSEKWNFTTGHRIFSSPAIGSDGTIYIGSWDKKLYALNSDGIEKWNFTTGLDIQSSPAIGADGTIYIGSYDNKLYAIGNSINQIPLTPPTPSGPTSGNINISYSFSTSATDPDDDQIKYGWDWDGDGSVDEWSALLPSGSEDNRSHSWPSAGNKEIKVKARDEHGDESGWSNIHTITITSPPSNQPPLTPPAPSGPTSGYTNTSYQFNATTTDPDGDQIKYGWDWDSDGNVDEWSGFMNSGTEDNRAHSWPSPGIYNVKVKAQDELGTESGWSDPLAVTITSPPSPSASITLEMTANVTYAEPEEIILYSVFYNTSFTSGTTTVLNHQQLTLENEIQIHPSFSPDGSKIVYTSFEDSGGYRDIWIMDVDGTNHQQLTFEDYYQIFPSFSPDGSKIVYTSIEDSGGYRDIWIMDADGTNHQQLTFEDADQWFPRFNPSGSKIVYNSNEDGVIDYDDIWIMDADGNNHQQLTFDDEDQFYPSFGPDGNKIVYSSKEDGGSGLDIWVMNVDGSNHQQLTFDYSNKYYPSFSPDGSKILYTSREDLGMYQDIWVMNSDGSDHQQLTNEDVNQMWPSFSMDGSKIVYHSKEDGDSDYDIWILSTASETTAKTIWINDTLPSGVTFVTSNAQANRIGDYKWMFTNVGPGEYSFTITVKINERVPNGTILTNFVHLDYIDSSGNPMPDSSDSVDVLVLAPENKPPIADAGSEQIIYEGDTVKFDGSSSYDHDGTIVSYEWDFDASDGLWWETGTLPDATSPTATNTYGDDGIYIVTLRVIDNGNLSAKDTCNVTVQNVNPTVTIESITMEVEIGLRVAGRKYNNVSMALYEDGNQLGYVSIERLPGSPDEQMAWIPVSINFSKSYDATVTYTPEDPPNIGSNPVWIYIKSKNGSIKKIHHTFNVQQSKKRDSEHWNHVEPWEVELNSHFIGLPFEITSHITDPGSDDEILTFTYGSQVKIVTYLNNPPNPDPYPSPEVNPVVIVDTTTLIYEGTGTVMLTVEDDDGGFCVVILNIS